MSAFKNGPTNKHGTLLPRFYLNKKRYIIDRKNHSNSLLTDVPSELASDDGESSFRSHLLWHHLMRIFPDLLPPDRLKTRRRYDYEAIDEARGTVYMALRAIGEANLSRHRAASAPDCKFAEEQGLQAVTTLSLFATDLQRILADLYGDFDYETMETIHHAILRIMRASTKDLLKDLWKEYDYACNVDYVWYKIGTIPGYGISSCEHSAAIRGADKVAHRARAVRAVPTDFCKYTIQFVKVLDKHWPGFKIFKHCDVNGKKVLLSQWGRSPDEVEKFYEI